MLKNIFNRFIEIQQKELKERVHKAVRIGGNNLHIILQKFVERRILNARHEGKKIFYTFNDIQQNDNQNNNGNGKALSETTETTEIINGNGSNGSIKEMDTEQEQVDIELVEDLANMQPEYHL